MTRAATGRRAVMPDVLRMHRLTVLASERFSPTFQRVTVGGVGLDDFESVGFDQWFRLFFPKPHQHEFRLPRDLERWWPEYRDMAELEKPHCANYTVAEFRPQSGEMDIDVVLHGDAHGRLEGGVAIWAAGARPGDELAILDQGRIFDRPDDAESVYIACDETGLPGVAGALRDLPSWVAGWAVIEVPDAGDIRPLSAPPGVDVNWVVRTASAAPGSAALEAVADRAIDARDAYAYVVGESDLATAGRRSFVRRGLAKDRITFSGYWRRSRH